LTQSGHRAVKLAASQWGHFREAGLTRYDALSWGGGRERRSTQKRAATHQSWDAARRRSQSASIRQKPRQHRSAVTNLEIEIVRLTRERDEALAREKATAEVLGVIAASSANCCRCSMPC